MKRYRVTLAALADVSTVVHVEADNEAMAEEEAMAKADEGDIVWEYRGVVDDPRYGVVSLEEEA